MSGDEVIEVREEEIGKASHDPVYDIPKLEKQADRGAKAYAQLRKEADAKWQQWEITIAGLAALSDLVSAKTGTRNRRSDAYRTEISRQMNRPRWAVYREMRPKERSACYALMDHLAEVSLWHAGLDQSDKVRWQHPETIVKHCPSHLLSDSGRNEPKKPRNKKGPKKRMVSAEEDRLRKLLLAVIKALMKYEPETAQKLMDEVMPQGVPDDDLEGI